MFFKFYLYAGDADGKGNTRKEELYQASAILKVIYNLELKHLGFVIHL